MVTVGCCGNSCYIVSEFHCTLMYVVSIMIALMQDLLSNQFIKLVCSSLLESQGQLWRANVVEVRFLRPAWFNVMK